VLIGEIAIFFGRRGMLSHRHVRPLRDDARLMVMVRGGGVVMLARRMLGGLDHVRTTTP
jgi:hypothetical protein